MYHSPEEIHYKRKKTLLNELLVKTLDMENLPVFFFIYLDSAYYPFSRVTNKLMIINNSTNL